MLTEQPAQGNLTKNAAHMRFRTLVVYSGKFAEISLETITVCAMKIVQN